MQIERQKRPIDAAVILETTEGVQTKRGYDGFIPIRVMILGQCRQYRQSQQYGQAEEEYGIQSDPNGVHRIYRVPFLLRYPNPPSSLFS